MDGATLFGRSMAFPPRVGPDGRVLWSEGAQNIRESIRIILDTEQGERLNLPAFGGGVRSALFEPNTVTTRFQIQDRITKALAAWEPRIIVTDVSVDPDPAHSQAAIATIQYKLVATQVREKIVVGVQLSG
jgi:phage baseplate assembly protein W